MLSFLWPWCLPEIKLIFCGFKRKNKKLILSKFWSRVNKLEVLGSASFFSSACQRCLLLQECSFPPSSGSTVFLLTAGLMAVLRRKSTVTKSLLPIVVFPFFLPCKLFFFPFSGLNGVWFRILHGRPQNLLE